VGARVILGVSPMAMLMGRRMAMLMVMPMVMLMGGGW
jgi:hypothetical protein